MPTSTHHRRLRGRPWLALFPALALIITLAATPPVEAIQPPTPGVFHSRFEAPQTIWNPTGKASFPSIFNASTTKADGTRDSRLMISYGITDDNPELPTNTTALIESTDADGAEWISRILPTGKAGVVNAVRLADATGTVITIDFAPSSAGGSQWSFKRYRANGNPWTSLTDARVQLWTGITRLNFHRGLLLLGDATTLLGTVYGKDGSGEFISLVRSTDGGETWTSDRVLARGFDFSESNLSFTSDGRLMVWMRRFISGDWAPHLYYSASTTADGTGAWTTPALFAQGTGNSPGSVLLGNGAVLQGSGRVGNVLRVKYSGASGTDGWTAPRVVYDNAPTSGTGFGGRPLSISGSSATVGLAPLTANTVLVVGDNCAAQWGCPSTAFGYPHGDDHFLWALTADVNSDQWGTLDLATKFTRGQIAFVNPALTTYGSAASPRQSLAAYAFDGDIRNDSSVVTTDRSVTLRLDREYSITGIGAVAQLRGGSDLTIQTSTDGSSWQTPSRAARSGIGRPFTAPVAARYLKITDPNPSGAAKAFLNELQVYTTVNGFEANAVGLAPVGDGLISSLTSQATIVRSGPLAPAVDPISSRLLSLKDTSKTEPATIAWQHGSSAAATFAFKARASGADTAGLVMMINGTNSGTAVPAYKLWINAPTGKLYRWDAAAATWGQPVGTLPANAWSWNDYEIVADGNHATIRQNGTVIATIDPSAPFTALTGNQLASTGSEADVDAWFFDDIEYRRP